MVLNCNKQNIETLLDSFEYLDISGFLFMKREQTIHVYKRTDN